MLLNPKGLALSLCAALISVGIASVPVALHAQTASEVIITNVAFSADFNTATINLNRDPGQSLSIRYAIYKGSETQERRGGSFGIGASTVTTGSFRANFDLEGGDGTYVVRFAVCPKDVNLTGAGIDATCGQIYAATVVYRSAVLAIPDLQIRSATFSQTVAGKQDVLLIQLCNVSGSVHQSGAFGAIVFKITLNGYSDTIVPTGGNDDLAVGACRFYEFPNLLDGSSPFTHATVPPGNYALDLVLQNRDTTIPHFATTITVSALPTNPISILSANFSSNYDTVTFTFSRNPGSDYEIRYEKYRQFENSLLGGGAVSTQGSTSVITGFRSQFTSHGTGPFRVDFAVCPKPGLNQAPNIDATCGPRVTKILSLGDTSSRANLRVTQSGPATVTEGGKASYEFVVTNDGGTAAENVVLSHDSPFEAGFIFDRTASSTEYCTVSDTPKCTIGTIPAGDQKIVRISFKIIPSYPSSCGKAIASYAYLSTSSPSNITLNTSKSPVVKTTVICTANPPPPEPKGTCCFNPTGGGKQCEDMTVTQCKSYRGSNYSSQLECSQFCFGFTVPGGTQTAPPAGYEDEVLTNIDTYHNPFPDTDTSKLSGRAAAELYRRAVIGGFPDGQFKGDRSVNRAEAAKFLMLARYNGIDDVYNDGKFPDVKDGEWYVPFVMMAARNGVINGYPDGMFRPGNQVNTAEFLKMFALTFGTPLNSPYSYSDVRSTDWFAPYAGLARHYNLFPDRGNAKLSPGKALTREEVAVAIYQYLAGK
ncbi:MAG: S-layer homology domain-containing protein [Candidatus Peregrinibacteria bacterium]